MALSVPEYPHNVIRDLHARPPEFRGKQTKCSPGRAPLILFGIGSTGCSSHHPLSETPVLHWRLLASARGAAAGAFGGLLLAVAPLQSQTDPILLSSACFDSLPFAQGHTCKALLHWQTERVQDSLIAGLAATLSDDSVTPAVQAADDNGRVAVVAARQPGGCCGVPFTGLDSLMPTRSLRLSTQPLEQGTEATMYIEATVRTVPGHNNGPLKLAMCYLLHVLPGLGVGPISTDQLRVVPRDKW